MLESLLSIFYIPVLFLFTPAHELHTVLTAIYDHTTYYKSIGRVCIFSQFNTRRPEIPNMSTRFRMKINKSIENFAKDNNMGDDFLASVMYNEILQASDITLNESYLDT